MSPFTIFGLCILAVLSTVILALSGRRRPKQDEFPLSRRAVSGRRPRSKPASYGRDDGQADVQPTFREIKKSEALSAPFGKRAFVPPTVHPTIALTPRMLERVNVQRKLRNKMPLNRAGFKNAVAHAWDRWEVSQTMDQTQWLAYLIAYQVLIADHQSVRCAGAGGLTIDPKAPYYGQGGEFDGAGASGQWDSGTAAAASAIASTTGTAGDGPSSADPNRQIDIYAAVADTVRGSVAAAPDPSPSLSSYSAPDPAPDSGSSY